MRTLTTLATSLVAMTALVACSEDPDASAADPAGTPSADGSTTPAAEDFIVIGTQYLQGPGRWALPALGDAEADLAVFDVPADFQGHQQWIWFDGGDDGGENEFGQMMYLAPTSVPSDPCRPGRPGRPGPELGDGVEAVARALAAQSRTSTTRPVEVSLDGHDGLYLELTTPAQPCPGGDDAFVSLAGVGNRELDPSSTDRYWILDVDGHRVVISAMTLHDATRSAVRRVRGIAETVSFVPAT